MKKIIVISFLTIISVVAYSQEESQFTQYMYNTININPAYAGSGEALRVFGMYRTQWLGVEGAPKTGIFSVEGLSGRRTGVGVNFASEQIGISDQSSITVDYAYHIPILPGYKLALGVNGTANMLNIDYDKLHSQEVDLHQENVEGQFSPNFGAGLFFYSNNFYLGVSVPNIFKTTRYDDTVKSEVNDHMQGYLISGYVFDISENFKFKMATIVNIQPSFPIRYDITGNLMFREKFVLGTAWRSSGTFSALAGFQVAKSLFLGYAYDKEMTKLSNYSSGTHELFLKYELGKNKNAMVPRFF